MTLKDVSFHFSKEPIIKGIDITLHQGEMVSLVGHNGAGKSTLSNLITGFLPFQKGELLWKGQSIISESIKERADKIGYVLQNSNQMLSKNIVFEEVALALENRGEDPINIQEKVLETLKVCGLYEFRNWPISALSYGQKRRVAVASILVLEPELLILDEPTDMHLMLEYTERTIVLKEGQIIADEIPSKVLSSTDLVTSASLRKTSLYHLAKSNQLTDASGFVSAFIQHKGDPYDRE